MHRIIAPGERSAIKLELILNQIREPAEGRGRANSFKIRTLFPSQTAPESREGEEMEKALVSVGSLKAGSFWISKKAKDEFSNITEDLTSFSNTVEEKAKWIFNKLKGKPLKSLPDLLREYNLPPGLFPQNITCYEFDESKAKLLVHMPSSCEVNFKDSTIRYSTRVKGTLLRGKLIGIEGIKTKVLVWVKVTDVAVEGYKSDKVWITAAGVKKSKAKDSYDVPRDAVRVKEF